MIAEYRRAFNQAFTDERYREFVDQLTRKCGVPIEFRLSETPCFFPAALIGELVGAGRAMIGQLLTNDYYRHAADAIVPPQFRIPNGENIPTFIQVDFGLVRTGGRIEGRLVELQAFPSLYGFQMALAETAHEVWGPNDTSVFPAPLDHSSYLRTVGDAIVGRHDPAEVVLMEIDPAKQKTLPDFAMTEKLWGVRTVDVRSVRREGGCLFYDRDGRRTRIRRIYNRVIPDDLVRGVIELPFDYRDALDVEWTGGPDWFFRISKFSLPWLKHPWVPKAMFLSEAVGGGADASRHVGGSDWLLKPLFSYAGGGIIFSPTETDIAAIPEQQRHLYVLQERVPFTPVIETPFGATQAEIRLMFVTKTGSGVVSVPPPTETTPDPVFVLPLVRMGRGKMMGVDHNKGLTWVGASAALSVS